MRTTIVWLAIGLLTCGCGDDETDGTVGGAGVGVSVVDGGGGAGTTGSSTSAGANGSAGTSSSQSGASGRNGGGSGTRAGGTGGSSATAGSGGTGSAAGSTSMPACTLECEPGQECVLVEVQCFRAPCPAQPMCMPEANGGGQVCGSRGQPECPAGQYCQYAPGANCGAADQGGHCAERSTICTREYNPVCGCDGKTYSNACEAGAAGTSVASQGECGARADADCDLRKIGCDVVEPSCAEGTTASVTGVCFGPCVPIESCKCTGPEQCPDPDHYTCHMFAAHCGPYV